MSDAIKKIKFLLTGLALSFALAFLLLVSPAYAEGEAPPESPAPIEQSGDTPSEETPLLPSAEEIDAAPAVEQGETPAEDPLSVTGEVVDPLPLELLVEDLAETDLVLADGSGEILDLASSETAEMLSGADPYFTVGATTYRFFPSAGVCAAQYPGDPFCFDNQGANVIQDALDYISLNTLVPTDGKLYVESGSYAANVSIDGSLLSLNGLIGVNTGSGNPLITGNVSIFNTLAGFTLQGFVINGQVLVSSNTGTLNLIDLDVNYNNIATSNRPISVFNHNGSINLNRVKSSGNSSSVSLDNTAGTGSITILNSAFDHNLKGTVGYAHGVSIFTNGNVLLDGVSASGNNGSGVFVSQGANLTVKNSVFSNNFGSPDNGVAGHGIYASVTGNITLTQVVAKDNERAGLTLFTPKAVTLTDVTANGNDNFGTVIDTTTGTGAVKVSYSQFSDNINTGLNIIALGPVTLTSVNALGNTWYGASIDNCRWNGSICAGAGTVTITSLASKGELFLNRFNGNGWGGLDVYSKSNILLENFQANGNGSSSGVNLNNSEGNGNVTVKATLPGWLNQTNGNAYRGLVIYSDGSVSIDRTNSQSNIATGIHIESQNGPSIKPVSVMNTFTESNGLHGLFIESRGLITLTNIESRNHNSFGAYGAWLNNTYGTGGAVVKASVGKTNVFGSNNYDGLYIQTLGSVSVSDAQFISNGRFGLRIFSQPVTSTPSVNLTRVVAAGNISNAGIEIYASGPVTLTSVNSSDHSNSDGVYINNTNTNFFPGVTVKDSSFNNNRFTGLTIYAKGAVLINTIEASYSTNNTGLYVDNCAWNGSSCGSTAGITLTAPKGKENIFTGNYFTGFYLFSNGNISVTNLRADSNQDSGGYINNSFTGSLGNVTINASAGQFSSASYNGLDGAGNGIDISSYGTVTISRLIVNSNNGTGAYINNQGALTPKNINITDSTFNNNQGTGLTAYADGQITLKGSEASDNSKYDWDITNGTTVNEYLSSNHQEDIWTFSGTSGNPVNIILQSTFFNAFLELRDANWGLVGFDDNSFGGSDAEISLNLPSTGLFYIIATSYNSATGGSYRLSLNDPTQATNVYYYIQGAVLGNNTGSAGINILPSASGFGGRFERNNGYGLSISTQGAITFNKLWSNYNGDGGFSANNSAGGNKNISLTSAYFDNNGGIGVNLYTAGNFIWNGGSASGNDYWGFYLDGTSAAALTTATLTNVSINGNGATGLQIYMRGNISLTSVNASSNEYAGGFVDNCLWNGSSCNGSGNITITSPATNSFDYNLYRGITLVTMGTVKITNISANGNVDTGVSISADYGSGSVTIQNTSTKAVNTINDNGNFGLYVDSAGAITVNKVDLDGNTMGNMRLANLSSAAPAAITVTSVKSTDSLSDGLYIQSSGAVTLKSILSTGNSQNGAYVDNYGSQPVLVTTSTFNLNGLDGLVVFSTGNITLNGITANENAGDGVELDNTAGSGKVEILGTLGENFFNANTLRGLAVYSFGDVISLSKVNLLDNSASGLYITNNGLVGQVTLNTVMIKGNSSYGAFIQTTNGQVSVSKATVLNNGSAFNDDGMYISTFSPLGVTISSSFFIGNEGSGLEIDVTNPMLVTITSTAYLGNDSDNTGDLDLNIY
jgi:hypothetical protein